LQKKHSILIIDDEINILKALKRILSVDDYEVIITINPLEALELLKTNNFDIIISDQRMPVMSGLKLLNQAKSISPKTKRVLISGFLDHKQPEDFVNYAEIISYITKPWIDEELRLTIRSILKMKTLEEENEKLIENIQKQNEELEAKNILLVGNIKNKKNQIDFVQKIIETSKIQLKTINRFLYIINSSTSIKETFSSLFSTIYNIIKFEEIGAVYSTPFEEKIKNDYQILNVLKNKRTLVRYRLKSPINNIKNILLKKSKMIVIQDLDRSRLYSQFNDCFVTPDIKQIIIVPLFNRDNEKKQFIGFIFLGSREKNFFQSSKLSLFTELLTILANTISEMIVFELIKDGGTQWEETFDAIQDPLILINKNFTVLRANHAAIKLSRTYIKNLIGKKCHNLFASRETQCENCPLLSEEHLGRFIDSTNERYYNVKSFKINDNYLIYYKDYTI